MMLDLDASNVVAAVRKIASLLETAPHVLLDLPPAVSPCRIDRRLGSEFGRNPAILEDSCFELLRRRSFQDARIGMIKLWWRDQMIIDADQAVFMATTCEIDPRELGR